MSRGPQNGMERRRHQRTRFERRIQGIRLDPDGGEVVEQFDTFDVSRSGLGGVSDRMLYPGQRVVLRLPLSQDSGQRNIYATIVRCRSRGERYQVGIEFDTASLDSYISIEDGIAAA